MIVEEADTKASTRPILASALVLLALIALNGSSALAESPTAKRRIIPVEISKGQNYTITGVKEGAATGQKVVNNPNALVVQNAPGRIEVVGADAGSSKIDVTLATGEEVTYVVTVKAAAPPQGSLAPGTAPTVIP
ncbi:MAG: hypothetical protein WCE23_05295 [Candidatus Binatus sp.]|uniref:hypothetical protein n=1 Tax=Candidatus Binatus sp. TaxID=2811406 RepID=UPI003C74E3D3